MEKNIINLNKGTKIYKRVTSDELGKLIYANTTISRRAIQQILATDSQSLFRTIEDNEEFYCQKVSTLSKRKRKVYSTKKQLDYKQLFEGELKGEGLLALRNYGLLTDKVAIDEKTKNVLTKVLINKEDNLLADIELLVITQNNLSNVCKNSFITNKLKICIVEELGILNRTVNRLKFLDEYLLVVIEEDKALFYIKQNEKVFKLEDKERLKEFNTGLASNKRLTEKLLLPYKKFENEKAKIKGKFNGGKDDERESK